MRKREENIHNEVCRYLDLQYPNVMYITDLSGIKLTMGQAVQSKKQRCKKFKLLDLNILQPSNGYFGLCIEIKKDVSEAFTMKGDVRNNEHIQAQNKSIRHLNGLGYNAHFGCGFDHCKQLIDNYFNNPRL
jgi:CRISPR/Cas system CSM-associated protein Csm4 (group 5 of RAMP superfamily)